VYYTEVIVTAPTEFLEGMPFIVPEFKRLAKDFNISIRT
jgi:hypothetical protein